MAPSRQDADISPYYNDEAVTAFLRVLQEATRATPKEGPSVYVPPAGGDKAEANYNHFVFGQRGSGKSSLLRHLQRKLEAEERAAVWIDQEIFSNLAYPDVLVSAVLEVMESVQNTLRNKQKTLLISLGWWEPILIRLRLRKRRDQLLRFKQTTDYLEKGISNLRTLKYAPLASKVQWVHSRGSEAKADVLGAIHIAPAEIKGGGGVKETSEVTSTHVVESTKEEYLERALVDFRRLLVEAAELCQGGFVFVDDLYLIKRDDQPLVLGYLHRLLKDSGFWLKIGSIRYLTTTYRAGDRPVGMQVAHDAHEVALDKGIRLLKSTQTFLETILENLAGSVQVDLGRLLTEGSRARLMLASGGVARDYLRLTAGAIEQARNRGPTAKAGTNRVIVEDVNEAAGTIAPSKLDDLKKDAPDLAAALRKLVVDLTEFCRQSKCAYFLIDAQDRELSDSMEALQHLRYAYLLDESETVPDRASQRFNVWLLDIAELSAQRATQQMDFDGWQKREKRRNRRRIFQKDWRASKTVQRRSLGLKAANDEGSSQEEKPSQKENGTSQTGGEPTLFDSH
jgi:energy-coupling factor transporter ATP-binding protein EcfA2